MGKKKDLLPVIFRRNSPIHGYGVYAGEVIEAGQRVVQYIGRRLTKKESEQLEDTTYLFELNSRYDIDGKNIVRYINHSCDPNCEVEIVRGQIWIRAIRRIAEGEELFYNYSYEMEEAMDYPCGCGADRCVGFILDEIYWKKLQGRKSSLTAGAA